MRLAIAALTAVSLVLPGCTTGTGGGTGSGVDPTVAAAGCGLVGGVAGSQIGHGSNRIIFGLLGAAAGAGLCGWLASRSWKDMEPGETECRNAGDTTQCVRNEPPPAEDECVERRLVQFGDTHEDAWRCLRADGRVDYYPVA